MSKEREPVIITGTKIKSEAELAAEKNLAENPQGASENTDTDANAQRIKQEENKSGAAASVAEANPELTVPTEQELFMQRYGRAPTIEELKTFVQVLAAEKRAKKKARLATVLDRGVLNDRFKVNLPPHLHGEWIRNDPLAIDEMRLLGFTVDTEYATNRQIHSDGSPANIIGDVIHMVCLKEDKELIDEIRAERQAREHGGFGKGIIGKEEQEFREKTLKDTGGIIPTFTESSARAIKKADIEAALDLARQQTESR